MTNTEYEEFINNKLEEIHEYCENVQIMVSWQEDRKTMSLCRGRGNTYARTALAREFIEIDRIRTKEYVAQDKKDDEQY